jgi:hypothetical protein
MAGAGESPSTAPRALSIIAVSSRERSPLRAEVAELADAQASGACGRKVVKVQILSSAPILNRRGPLHPAWRPALRSRVAARSAAVARELRLASHAKVVRRSGAATKRAATPHLTAPRSSTKTSRLRPCSSRSRPGVDRAEAQVEVFRWLQTTTPERAHEGSRQAQP